MIYAKRKLYSGHWIIRDGVKIGEAWKYPNAIGFGMSIGGHFTNVKQVYWRNGNPAEFGAMRINAPRLLDLVAIAEKHFGKKMP